MLIRRGVTRTVILTKRYAIKIPRLKHHKDKNGKYGNKFSDRLWGFCRGVLANQSESEWTAYANSAYGKPQVCPVIKSFLGGVINIYPRAEVEWTDSKLDDMYDQLEFKTPSDVHIGNLGYYKGYPVWLDYDMNYNDCKRCGVNA